MQKQESSPLQATIPNDIRVMVNLMSFAYKFHNFAVAIAKTPVARISRQQRCDVILQSTKPRNKAVWGCFIFFNFV